ncbi:CgeB family protein [Candidatus Acetatifactor stercoripullorum]|uniref:CgeB family protein n=1 Tax=Candidatus Acetatifactor stercoripullorum TaxID=2838414 RepID=UPI00298E13F0|nr:glycosyltransferase [Candidatus Acetatifactor stercoripullorum]
MKQVTDEIVRILHIQTNEISILDIPRVLDTQGYEVYQGNFGLHAQKYEAAGCRRIIAAIEDLNIQCVVSYDFIITIAQACFEAGIPYASWVYDAPQKELYTHYAMYPCNYIFAFDKMQVRRLKEIGIRHVVHMPLAVDGEKVKMVTDTIGKKMKKGYQSQITFIGQLYNKGYDESYLQQTDEDCQQQVNQAIDACFLKWDKSASVYGLLSEKCAAAMGEIEGHKVQYYYPYMSEQFFYEALFVCRILANRERVHVLNKLAEHYEVIFYTNDENTEQLSDRVKVKPGMTYDVLSHIYRRSKINLNMTLHCIETGVPQRVLDVMAAGGFMLSNYQEELEEMFVPGEEIVLYHNEEELMEYVAYYLAHDEERERIAQKGREKVLQKYDFKGALAKVFQYVNQEERDRQESYIDIQAEELRKQVNQLLAQKEEQRYQRLYTLLTDRKYDTTIRKFTDLHTVRLMAEFSRNEATGGKRWIFEDVDNIHQAEHKYVSLKHALWRIEQGLPYEKCVEAVKTMRQKGISKCFIAWMICANLREREDTFVKTTGLLAEYSKVEAIELLTYGLLFLEKSQKLLMQKADLLMELNLWEEALKTLQAIEEPDGEVAEVIRELSEALYGVNG